MLVQKVDRGGGGVQGEKEKESTCTCTSWIFFKLMLVNNFLQEV